MGAQQRLGSVLHIHTTVWSVFVVLFKKLWVLGCPESTTQRLIRLHSCTYCSMSNLMTKPTKWPCAQRRLGSAWASAQSDQSLCYSLNGWLRTQASFMRTGKTLIRLGGCPGWSESSLGAHAILLVLSWGGSYVIAGCIDFIGFVPALTHMSHVMRKPAFAICEQQRRRSACANSLRSLISTFVIRCLDSIIPLVSIYEILSL